MIVGVPKEIKADEFRVGLTPSCVQEVVKHQHQVLVETQAGVGSGFPDSDFDKAGAEIVEDAEAVFARAEMIVKVKEPQPEECRRLRAGQVLFTFLHLAPDPQQCALLQESGCAAVAYETVTGDQNSLPLLAPMSAVAGRLSVQAGAHCLEKPSGGRGVLLGGVYGVEPARVLIIGGGVVGINAAFVACGMGADVTIMDKSLPRLQMLETTLNHKVHCLYATTAAIERYAETSDLVIGAVLVAGARAPNLLGKEHLPRMLSNAVLVDVAIDQGGCFESSRPTTHHEPTYELDGVLHYCVANIPGATPRTSSHALNNASLPFVLKLADLGLKSALRSDPHLMNGLNVYEGKVTQLAVTEALGMDYVPASEALG